LTTNFWAEVASNCFIQPLADDMLIRTVSSFRVLVK